MQRVSGATVSSTTTIRPAIRPRSRRTAPRGARLRPRVRRETRILWRAGVGACRRLGGRRGRRRRSSSSTSSIGSIAGLGLRAGLMLIPLGLLNEHHEPANYYGVERNFVETAIIPSTWREGGVSAFGSTESGLNWKLGITTGSESRKWDAASDEGRESPLGSIHQELQLASARDRRCLPPRIGRASPGLTLGGGVFTGKIGQERDFAGGFARSCSAKCTRVGSRGRSTCRRCTPAARSAIPRCSTSRSSAIRSRAGIVLGRLSARRLAGLATWRRRRWRRSSVTKQFNTAASYAPMPLGLGVPAAADRARHDPGINYWLMPGVVFKADYQRFKVDDAARHDRLNLGVGYQF